MDINEKTLGVLIDELITTCMKCWFAQENVMNPDLSEKERLNAAIRTQEMNDRRNRLIRSIDSLMGHGKSTPSDKSYSGRFGK